MLFTIKLQCRMLRVQQKGIVQNEGMNYLFWLKDSVYINVLELLQKKCIMIPRLFGVKPIFTAEII